MAYIGTFHQIFVTLTSIFQYMTAFMNFQEGCHKNEDQI